MEWIDETELGKWIDDLEESRELSEATDDRKKIIIKMNGGRQIARSTESQESFVL